MKAIAVLALCLSLSVAWTGCAPSEPAATIAAQTPSLSVSEVIKDTQAPDGAVVFTKTYPRIDFTFSREGVAQAVEADLQERIDVFLDHAAEIETFAREDYTGQTDWTAYFAKIRYSTKRLDSMILSLYCEYSSFSGSSHPTLATQSVTYDLTDGQTVQLDDLLVEGYSASRLSILVNASLSGSADQLYDDYEAIVGNLFSAPADEIGNWYFSDEGLCFHFAPYEVAPYAAGTVIATISYEELEGIVRQQYFPA